MSSPTNKELTSLGIFLGRLSETHIKNLESFPFIYFNGVKEAHVDYDVAQAKDSSSYIAYYLVLNENNDHLDKRFEGLETAIRSLFWKEIELRLSINGKEYKND